VLISTQDRCTVCADRTIGSEIILAQLMVLLRDVGQVETHFGTFGDSVNLEARKMHDLCHMYHRLINKFGCT
jgi:hypothetical protein